MVADEGYSDVKNEGEELYETQCDQDIRKLREELEAVGSLISSGGTVKLMMQLCAKYHQLENKIQKLTKLPTQNQNVDSSATSIWDKVTENQVEQNSKSDSETSLKQELEHAKINVKLLADKVTAIISTDTNTEERGASGGPEPDELDSLVLDTDLHGVEPPQKLDIKHEAREPGIKHEAIQPDEAWGDDDVDTILPDNPHTSLFPIPRDRARDIDLLSMQTPDEDVKPTNINMCHKNGLSSQSKVEIILPRNSLRNQNNSAFKCDICGKLLCSLYLLKKHMMSLHEDFKPPKCKICSRTFITVAGLQKHHDDHHNNMEIYECQECHKDFPTIKSFRIHQMVHKTEPLKCDKCEKTFRSQTFLKMHEKAHEVKAITCPICGKEFARRYTFQMHMTTHDKDPPRCKPCKKNFLTAAGLKKHKDEHHNHNNTAVYQCEICHMKFPTEKSIKSHSKKHNVAELTCEICSKVLRCGEARFNIHVRSHATVNTYNCEYCGSEWSTQRSLRKHINTHIKPHKCSLCGQGFSQKIHMIAHQSVHTGERNYQCTTCGKKFGRAATLTKHKKIHQP